MGRCGDHQRHWYSAYGKVGERQARCVRCGAKRRDVRFLVAWRVRWYEFEAIVAASWRAGACSAMFRSLRKAEYSPRYQEIRAVRAPEYDGWADGVESGSVRDPKDFPEG